MKRIFESFLVVAAFLFAEPALAQGVVRVVVYGDSLTAGYQLQPEQAFPARLERKLREYGFDTVQVINMGKIGATTTDGANNLDKVLVLHPDVVVVEFGINDVMRGVTTDLIYRNLATICNRLRDNGVYTVLLGVNAPASMGYNYGAQLDKVYRNIAGDLRIALYPYAMEGVLGHQELSLADSIHPNAKGVDLMVERIYPLVDAGVRWKYQLLQYQQDYQQQQQQQLMLEPGAPPPVTP